MSKGKGNRQKAGGVWFLRRGMRLLKSTIFTALMMSVLIGASSQALACARTFESPDGLFLSYDEVFLARIGAMKSVPGPENDGEQIVAEYELLERFRGLPPSQGQVSEFHARSVMTSCDSNVLRSAKPGDEVFFYAHISRREPSDRVSGVDSSVIQDAVYKRVFIEQLRKFRAEQFRKFKIEQP